MWWDIIVSGLILLVFTWYILETTETWRRGKENCSNDAMSVYVCESNKECSENTISREFTLEWVIRATVSLILWIRSGIVIMDIYQWLSNMYACHYMLTFTASHTSRCKSTEQGQQEWQDNWRNSQRTLLWQFANQWY